MGKNKFGYLVRQGVRNIFSNGLMSFASVSVLVACLILVGGAFLVYFNIQKGIEYVGSMGEIVLFVDDSFTEEECGVIEATLNSIDGIHDVTFTSSADALNEMKDEIAGGEELFSLLDGQQILPHSFSVKVSNSDDYEAMVQKLSQIYGISEVVANGKIANTLSNISHAVATFGIVVVVVLMVVSVFILTNTLKLAMVSRRREIFIMKMVGATNAFVRIPFFVEGVVLGGIAAVIGYIVIRLAYVGLSGYLAQIGVSPIDWADLRWTVALAFLAVGFFAGLLSSSVSIKKYLKA